MTIKAKQKENFDVTKFKFAFEYFVYGTEGLLKDWAENGCAQPPEEFAKILKEVASY